MRRFLLSFGVAALCLSGAAFAQDRGETLADIRQELSVLYVELQKLKRELSTTGSAGGAAAGGSVLDRVAAIESEVQRLTSKTEELEFRIDRVVTDGTNRLGDLEFRLCEMESDCDVSKLGQGTTLGGVKSDTGGGAAIGQGGGDISTGTDSSSSDSGVQMAVGEKADFDAASKALDGGDFAAAADQFALFLENYPGSPLSAEAGLKRGEALEKSGATTKAARAYLDTFSAAPSGPKAADALFRLGRALGELGQTDEACVTLAEVGNRFPGGAPAQDAQAEMQGLGCQ